MNVASIKTAASDTIETVKQNRFVKNAQAALTSDTAKEVGKTVAVGSAAAVGLGIGYALFVKSAQVAHSLMS